jgi:hypothetical protein
MSARYSLLLHTLVYSDRWARSLTSCSDKGTTLSPNTAAAALARGLLLRMGGASWGGWAPIRLLTMTAGWAWAQAAQV